MTILITGVAGQDGMLLSRFLASKDEPVIGLCRSTQETYVRENIPGITAKVVDVSDHDAVEEILNNVRPTKIFNLAGFSSVRDSWNNQELTFQINTELPKALINWVKKESPETVFIQATSSEIFADSPDSPQTEQSLLAPTSPYGKSKADAHEFLTRMREVESLNLISAILYNHESPLRSPTFVTRHISQGIARIACGIEKTLPIGDINSQRDWGWAPDYVRTMWEISKIDIADNYLISTGLIHSVNDLLMIGFESIGISDYRQYVVTDSTRTRKVDPQSLVGDSSYVKEKVGWVPTVTIEEVITRMIKHDINLLTEKTEIDAFSWLN